VEVVGKVVEEVAEEVEEVAGTVVEKEVGKEGTASVASSSLVATAAEVTAGKVQTMRLALRRVLAVSVWTQLEEMLGIMPDGDDDDDDVRFVFWAGSVLAACGILGQEKLYDLAFGGPTNVTVVDGKPTWTKVQQGEGEEEEGEGENRFIKRSLRDSHEERVRVLELYVAAVVRASGC
jgi:hypothetical protein